MASEAITQNDLKNILDGVLPTEQTEPTGYGTAVDITSYTSSTPYEAPSNGLFQVHCTYRQNNYVQGYVDGMCVIQASSTGNTGMCGNNLICVPVFKGQQIYAVKSSTYSYAYFIPFI